MPAQLIDNVAYYERLADVYSLFFQDFDTNMEEEGAWLDALLRPLEVRTVLDACCGTGRQALPLAERGYEVVGADPSPAMLREAAARARERNLCLPLIQAAFQELPERINGGFDAVIALGNGLCHLESQAAILAALRALRACGRAESICVIGIKDFDAVRGGWDQLHTRRVLDDAGQRTALYELWSTADPHLIVTAYLVRQTCNRGRGKREVTIAQTREYMLNRRELEEAAALAGFRQVRRLAHLREAVYMLR